MHLRQRLIAEFLGTAFLLATVVGSGIMGERLAGGNVGIALLANALATGAILVCLILTFGRVSSHFNPVVTAVSALQGEVSWKVAPAYIVVQTVAAIAGVVVAHLMFGLTPVSAQLVGGALALGVFRWFPNGVEQS